MDDKINKILTNLEKINKISGFHITAPGDESVGIFPSSWKLDGDFYFDTPEELNNFKEELKNFFEISYCGENVDVITDKEYEALCNEYQEQGGLENDK